MNSQNFEKFALRQIIDLVHLLLDTADVENLVSRKCVYEREAVNKSL